MSGRAHGSIIYGDRQDQNSGFLMMAKDSSHRAIENYNF